VIIALHFGGPMTPFKGGVLLSGLVEPALRELGAIIAAPDCPVDDWTNLQSERAVIALLDHLQNAYSIDSAKALITGYSLGGIGTWHIAARHQDRFAAALPISARPPADAANVEWKIPLYAVHSKRDELFPVELTDATVRHLQAKGASVHLALVDDATHFEVHRFVEPLRATVPWMKEVMTIH
jgi:predicted peptidase